MPEHEPSISVSLEIDASAHALFSHLTRPTDHPAIDGSGMLRGSDDRHLLSGIGDVFEIWMFNDTLGDYLIENHVVEFEPDRRIAWEPVLKSTDKPEHQSRVGDRAHLRWGWELTPRPGGGTLVTEFYDLSAAPEWLHQATNEGEDWRVAMEVSLRNLARRSSKLTSDPPGGRRPPGDMWQGTAPECEGVNCTCSCSEVDGTRSVNFDQDGIRQVQRSRYGVHPLLDDLVTLMLGEMTCVPGWIIDASTVPLRSNIDRTSAVDLYDPPIESKDLGLGDSSLEVGFENHFRNRRRQGVHNNVARPA